MFNSRQYEYSDITLAIGAKIIVGCRGIKYASKQEKEHVYGKGNEPLHIQRGNISHEGEITVLQSELETLRAEGQGSILGLRLDGVVAYGNPSQGDVLITDKLIGIEFTEDGKEMKQGDKFMEVTLPFICMRIKNQG